jgi:hypothetical protein
VNDGTDRVPHVAVIAIPAAKQEFRKIGFYQDIPNMDMEEKRSD